MTRRIERHIRLEFNLDHIPGAKAGLVAYISKQPHEDNTANYDTETDVTAFVHILEACRDIITHSNQATQNMATNKNANAHSFLNGGGGA